MSAPAFFQTQLAASNPGSQERRGWFGKLRGPPGLARAPLSPFCPCPHPCSYYKGIRQMVQVSDQDMNTHLAEISRVSRARQGWHWTVPGRVELVGFEILRGK